MATLNLMVDVQDVADAIKGGVPDGESRWVATQLGRAMRLLSRLRPGLQQLVDDGGLDPGFVRDIVVEAVLRVVRNPDGVYREQEGEYGYSRSVDVASGRLEFLPSELALLSAKRTTTRASIPLVVPRPPGSAFSITPGGES